MLLDQTTNVVSWAQGQYQQQGYTFVFAPQQPPQIMQYQQQAQAMLKVRRSDCKCVVCRVEYDNGK